MASRKELADYLDKLKGKLVSCALAGGGDGIAVWTGVLDDFTSEAVILQHQGEQVIIMLHAIAYIRPREETK